MAYNKIVYMNCGFKYNVYGSKFVRKLGGVASNRDAASSRIFMVVNLFESWGCGFK